MDTGKNESLCANCIRDQVNKNIKLFIQFIKTKESFFIKKINKGAFLSDFRYILPGGLL